MVAYNKPLETLQPNSQARTHGLDVGGRIDPYTAQRFADGMDTQLHVFTNGWLLGKQFPNGEYDLDDFGRYQVQMDGKGSVVKMLQRRLGIAKQNTASVGDSAGDISMFQESGYPICFNPWDDRPKKHAAVVIEEKDPVASW